MTRAAKYPNSVLVFNFNAELRTSKATNCFAAHSDRISLASKGATFLVTKDTASMSSPQSELNKTTFE